MTFNKNNDNLIIIFSKKIELGKVKTRIARETSDSFALEFSKACFSDLLGNIGKSDYYDILVGVDDLDTLYWYQRNYHLDGFVISDISSNPNLNQSEKLEIIFSSLINNFKYKKVILIPMDIPFIKEEDIVSAFARLDNKRAVLGPEINGGIYLIGLNYPYKKNVFCNVRWSTQNSFSDLYRNISSLFDNNIFSLKLKNDLNSPEDILALKNDIRYNCPLLYKFLLKNGYYKSLKKKFINYDDLSISIPVVSCIIKKSKYGVNYILIQNRYRPVSDPDNTGKIEIPSTLVRKFETPQETITKDIMEEQGLIIDFSDSINKVEYNFDKSICNYYPISCVQFLSSGRPYLQMTFLANYKKGSFSRRLRKSRNLRWVSENRLKKILSKNPERFYPLTLSALLCYYEKN